MDDRDALIEELTSALHTVIVGLHPMYGSTATCGGGIGGQMVTQHCAITCYRCGPDHEDELYAAQRTLRDGMEHVNKLKGTI